MTSLQNGLWENNILRYFRLALSQATIVKTTFYISVRFKMADFKRWSYPRNVRFSGKKIESFLNLRGEVEKKLEEFASHGDKLLYQNGKLNHAARRKF